MLLLKKIQFLVQSKAIFNIYSVFLINKIKNIFIKKKIKNKKREHQNFLKNKNITHDFFSSHAYNFFEVLKKFNSFTYLEIGSFEGNSAIYIAQNFPNSQIHCVDNWVGTEEYGNLKFSNVEKNFDQNIINYKNIIKYKQTSDDFFIINKKQFDVIYIDGYHKGSQVLKDFKNSWKVLKTGGIIIFDDYIWKFFDKIEDNPCYAINIYLRIIKNNIKIMNVSNSQLYIRKLS
tara:strand:+ start:639 stop:1334 length:696 start_codon:yes stop_codon:yes gene_type:complete